MTVTTDSQKMQFLESRGTLTLSTPQQQVGKGRVLKVRDAGDIDALGRSWRGGRYHLAFSELSDRLRDPSKRHASCANHRRSMTCSEAKMCHPSVGTHQGVKEDWKAFLRSVWAAQGMDRKTTARTEIANVESGNRVGQLSPAERGDCPEGVEVIALEVNTEWYNVLHRSRRVYPRGMKTAAISRSRASIQPGPKIRQGRRCSLLASTNWKMVAADEQHSLGGQTGCLLRSTEATEVLHLTTGRSLESGRRQSARKPEGDAVDLGQQSCFQAAQDNETLHAFNGLVTGHQQRRQASTMVLKQRPFVELPLLHLPGDSVGERGGVSLSVSFQEGNERSSLIQRFSGSRPKRVAGVGCAPGKQHLSGPTVRMTC